MNSCNSYIQKLNDLEVQLIKSKIADQNEPEDQKDFWKDDLINLKVNPARYWNAFALDCGNAPFERIESIKSAQMHYREAPTQLEVFR